MKPLPLDFVKRMKSLLGEAGFERYEAALAEPSARALRVNTAKISAEEFERAVDFKVERIPYIENAYFFECDRIGAHPFHHAGMIYVQECAAMMPAQSLEIGPDWKILDMCAAPGGKSTQLKNRLGENGLLVSNEIEPQRCRVLASNVERLGLKNTAVTCASPDRIAEALPETFDMIMVDAPCSGEGMFRKEEEAIEDWSLGNVRHCAERQEHILECAYKSLKKGGYIVYSTCTFSLEENEMTVDGFLSRHPELELLPVNGEIRSHTEDGIRFDGCRCDNITDARRFYPHTGKGEGQFMALIHSTAEPSEEHSAEPEKRSKKGKKGSLESKKSQNTDFSSVESFLKETLVSFDVASLKARGDRPVLFGADTDLKGLQTCTLALGAEVGEVKPGYVQPSHALFMAYGSDFKRKIDLKLGSEELKKYLRGEQIEVDCEDGWAVITVCGCALGGVKVVKGIAKNHYPKGLRAKS